MSALATHNPRNAVELIRLVEPTLAANGYHSALTGSVLYKGGSEKDTDIIIYPHHPDNTVQGSQILSWLLPHGITPVPDHNDYIDYPGRQVARCMYQGRRIDIFVKL